MSRFSEINRKNSQGYDANYQRHHIIPLQASDLPRLKNLASLSVFDILDFDNFEINGVLLPCTEEYAFLTGRALHRGPHPHYNNLVIERLRLIDQLGLEIKNSKERQIFFHMKVGLLQAGLRRCLTSQGFAQLRLNKRDPGPEAIEFLDIDTRVDMLCNCSKWADG